MKQVDKKFKSDLKTAEIVLKKLIFDKINLEYDFKPEYNRRLEKWGFSIWTYVDVDKCNPTSPTYSREYDSFFNDFEKKIENALRYVQLHNIFNGVLYDYINDDFTEVQIDELNVKLYSELENLYNVRNEEIQDSETYYWLYKSDSDSPYIRVEGLGRPVEVEDEETGEYNMFYGCGELSDLMLKLYRESPLPWDYENYVCE